MNDLDGNPVKLSDFRGKKGVLLVFFATWCPYCMEEVPGLIAFQNRYKGRSVELIGDDLDQPAQVVKRFAEERKMNYKLVLDPDGTVATAYGVVGIPTFVAIDAAGTIATWTTSCPATWTPSSSSSKRGRREAKKP